MASIHLALSGGKVGVDIMAAFARLATFRPSGIYLKEIFARSAPLSGRNGAVSDVEGEGILHDRLNGNKHRPKIM
jgi:hypothetical protein